MIEWRSAGGDRTQLPKLAADLVQRKMEVILATGTVAAQAATRATSTIPIVITVVADSVGSGLVTSLAHPGGDVTGFSNMLADLSVKRLQLLKEAIPRLTRVAILWNPDTPASQVRLPATYGARDFPEEGGPSAETPRGWRRK